METGQILMDVFLFVLDAILLLTGYLVKYHASEYPDTFCGFHAGKLAVQSESAWREANRYCGSFLLKSALLLLIPDILLVILTGVHSFDDMTVFEILFPYLMLSAIVPTVLSIVLTNRHLKKGFGKDGKEKRKG